MIDKIIQNEIVRMLLEELDDEFGGDIMDAFEPFSNYEITIKEMYIDDDDEIIADIVIDKRG